MVWSNGKLTVYHGTDHSSASAIHASGIELFAGRSFPDFGEGFYTATSRHQAEQWANKRARDLGSVAKAAIITFEIDRVALGSLAHLAFVEDTADFYAFVDYARAGGHPTHAVIPCYDVVYGPVSMWPQRLTIKDCDQISFHTPRGIGVVSYNSTTLPPGSAFF